MTDLYSTTMAGEGTTPKTRVSSPAYGARTRRYRSLVTLAAQATTDNILLAIIPKGEVFCFGLLNTSVTLDTAVIAIGTSKVHGSNGQLRAAAVFTSANTPTLFGLNAATAADALTSDTPIYLTIATAALPASGTLVVDLFYCHP